MLCDDCRQARENSAYRRFDVKCLWCGARYARIVRTDTNLQLPAEVAGEQLSRRQWFEHVITSWTGWGHDQERLLELARGSVAPFAPAARAVC